MHSGVESLNLNRGLDEVEQNGLMVPILQNSLVH